MKINTIITAGGSSQRYGVKNKLFEPCGTSCVLTEAIKPFLKIQGITKIIVGIESSFADECAVALDRAGLSADTRIVFSLGGASRTKTVKNALNAIEDDADYILVHDGARPYVSTKTIEDVLKSAERYGAALPLAFMSDAMVDISNGVTPVDRANFRRVQTPFCAEKNLFVKAYKNAQNDFYDDISVIKTCFSGEIGIVDGDPSNIKITYRGDLKANTEMLTGCGYDVHKLQKGRGIKLLGVPIHCDFSFVAHSDGDVPIHALMDAILSAIGEKDIGHLFPVDDPKYDDADSVELLKIVLSMANKKGYKVQNVSTTIIAQRPMLAPYIDNMQARMSSVLNISASKIGISATTNEEVGEIGNGQAIAAYATVLLSKN